MAYVFKVEDMTCNGCAASVRGAVKRVPGVQGIETDPASRRVVVETLQGVDRATIVAAINAAGYTEITPLDE